MKRILTIPALLVTMMLSAAPVGEKKARELAEAFFNGCSPTRSVTAGAELSEDLGLDNNVYVYNRQDGGFVVIAGDDRYVPVIAYSFDGTIDPDNMPPAASHLLRCWSDQIASGYSSTRATTSTGTGNVVCKYETPLWGQAEPFNWEAPAISNQRCLTGCVATAAAIVLYYNKWPLKGFGTVPSYVFGSWRVPENELGRSYDYANMLMDYSGSYTMAQGNAVAALMFDLGTSVRMSYGLSASSASSRDIALALSTYFSYSKSATLVSADMYDDRGWIEALQNNLRQCGPTIVNGVSPDGGHAFIVDGYTDKGYFSVNFGWNGFSNGYFLMPSIEYNRSQGAIFDLVPDKTGASSYVDNLELIPLYGNDDQLVYSGLSISSAEYTPGASYTCQIGGLMNCGQVGFNGKFKLAVCDRQGNIRNSLTNEISLSDLKLSYYIKYSISIVLPLSFQDGDRIRLMYKGQYSDTWKWARKSDPAVCDEIILSASPEEISEALGLKYSKTAKTIVLKPDIPVGYNLLDSKSTVVASGKVGRGQESAIDVSGLQAGDYLLSVTCGGQPYKLSLTL